MTTVGVRRIGFFLGVLVLLNALGGALYAHGGGTPRLTAADAGPYSVFAWTEPEPWRAGEVHVTVAVTTPPPGDAVINNDVVNNLLEQPVEDAQVTVTFRPLAGGDPIVVPTQPGALNAFYLEADTVLPHAGDWAVDVDVSGPDGAGVATFTANVLAAQQLNRWVLLAGGAGFLALLVLIGVRARLAGTKQPTPQRTPKKMASTKSP